MEATVPEKQSLDLSTQDTQGQRHIQKKQKYFLQSRKLSSLTRYPKVSPKKKRRYPKDFGNNNEIHTTA